MSEQAVPQHVPERILCPNCPADYPHPFSEQHICCRRCGTRFLAPTDARTPKNADDQWTTESPIAHDITRAFEGIVDHFPLIGLSFNLLAVALWLGGYVSFEVTVLTILLITSAFVAERH